MQVVIFAGGLGTRLSEETDVRPKPMVEIGGKPILWHIMKLYAHYGHKDFIVCLGYKGHVIKEYFLNYFIYNSDIRIDVGSNKLEILGSKSDDFKVTLVDTGQHTKTAGRLQQVKHHLQGEDFMLTYGDGLSDINIDELLAFHRSHDKIATVTAVSMASRFGGMEIADNAMVTDFKEKAKDENKWINGGFFVLRKNVFEYLSEDMSNMMWEDQPLEHLTRDGQLAAFKHSGFWKPMDALRDKMELEELWKSNNAKWKKWD